MRSADSGFTNADFYLVAGFRYSCALGVQSHIDLFACQNVSNCVGYIVVFTAQEFRPAVDHYDLTPEAPVHLSELQADITAADDDQVARQEIDIHHRGVVQIGNGVETGDFWYHRSPADVNEDLIRGENGIADAKLAIGRKSGMALEDAAIGRGFEPIFYARPGRTRNLVLARLHPRHIYRDCAANAHSEIFGAARDVGSTCAGDKSLGRNTSRVHTSPAEAVSFDDCDLASGFRQSCGQRWSGLSGTYYDCVVELGHD
jgi:hypothetical protein